MRDTEAMLGSASPRKPSVPTRSRSSMRRDLAGRVPRQRERQLVALDAAAVVAHAAQARAALFDLDLDAARAGIDAVLDQLLEHGRRALDDLAGSDLVDELFGKDADRHDAAGRKREAARRIRRATGRSGGLTCRAMTAACSAVAAPGARDDSRVARLRAQLGDAACPAADSRRSRCARPGGSPPRGAAGDVGIAQARLFGRIGDERGLDQHRRNVRRLQHEEAGVLDAAARDVADAVQLVHHLLRGIDARAHARALRKIEQHRGQHAVLVVERHAADQVGRILAIRQPARGFVARAARRQHVHRRADDGAVAVRIGMDRDEHVGLLPARARDALAMLDEMIAVARQHGAHAGLAIDALLQAPRDRERHVLLARAALADRARIDAAVAGVDRDDRCRGRALRSADFTDDRRRAATRLATEIDDQAMAVGCRTARR